MCRRGRIQARPASRPKLMMVVAIMAGFFAHHVEPRNRRFTHAADRGAEIGGMMTSTLWRRRMTTSPSPSPSPSPPLPSPTLAAGARRRANPGLTHPGFPPQKAYPEIARRGLRIHDNSWRRLPCPHPPHRAHPPTPWATRIPGHRPGPKQPLSELQCFQCWMLG